MKDRMITLLGALAALYVFIALFIHPQASDFIDHSRPTSEDQGVLGLKSLHSWLQKSNVPTYRLRRRYSNLGKLPGLRKSGNLMIISLPQFSPVRDKELHQLRRWVARGNDLLILTASSDAQLLEPESPYQFSTNDLLEEFGFRLHYKPLEKAEVEENRSLAKLGDMAKDANKDKAVVLRPIGANPLTAGVKKVSVKTRRFFAPVYTLTAAPFNRASMALLKDKKGNDAAFWEIRHHHSRIWISRFGFLFSNSQLAEADNARLAANIVSASLSRGGSVIFDDMHQGSTELYDEQAFYADSRLHASAWFVFAFWLLYVVGHTNRIAPLARRKAPAKVSDFVHAMANLFARRLSRVASAKLLFSHFFDWIRLRYSLPTNGQPVWQLLERTERIDKHDLARLKQNFLDVQNNKKVDLMKLVNRMQKIRSTLS